MSSGYIYILINESFPGLIKIGSTSLGAKQRAKKLSNNTAVPTPFVVAYERYIDNYVQVEHMVHNVLEKYRVNTNREFFKYSVDEAIELLQQLASCSDDGEFEALEILPRILQKYPGYILSNIVSARICQDGERVYFEFTKENYLGDHLKDQIIYRQDLGYIIWGYKDIGLEDPKNKMFKANYEIDYNVQIFMELDDVSMANCVGEIFKDDWFHHIQT